MPTSVRPSDRACAAAGSTQISGGDVGNARACRREMESRDRLHPSRPGTRVWGPNGEPSPQGRGLQHPMACRTWLSGAFVANDNYLIRKVFLITLRCLPRGETNLLLSTRYGIRVMYRFLASSKSGTGPPGTEIGALPAGEVFHNNRHRGFPLKHQWSF